jgi:hypothetical protein
LSFSEVAGLEKDLGRFLTPEELEKLREHIRDADERAARMT